MTAPTIRELMARVILAQNTVRKCHDANWNAANMDRIRAEDALRMTVAEKLGGLDYTELRKLGDVL